MLRKISMLSIFLFAVGIAFFALLIDKRFDTSDSMHREASSPAEAYCRFKKGVVVKEPSGIYCTYHEQRESAQNFFERLGEWEPSEIIERTL